MQGELEGALRSIFGREVQTFGAGRTDAGVHALGQVVGCPDLPKEADPDRIQKAVNGMCGPSISIWRSQPAPPEWHARYSAISRAYVYAILISEVADPFLDATTWRVPQELNVPAMNEAAGQLLGEHDFSSFGRATDEGAGAVRTLIQLNVEQEGSLIRVRARANSFIQQMVRTLAGTLVSVGMGRTSPADMISIMESKDRAAAGPVAPAHGLCLIAVEYDEGWSRPFDPF